MGRRVPGIRSVEAVPTGDGRLALRFHDGAFDKPFIARHVSDGTIKMFAYLLLLHDPEPHPLLTVEEPENHVPSRLLRELADEFRAYAKRGGQVFVSSHSPRLPGQRGPERGLLFRQGKRLQQGGAPGRRRASRGTGQRRGSPGATVEAWVVRKRAEVTGPSPVSVVLAPSGMSTPMSENQTLHLHLVDTPN